MGVNPFVKALIDGAREGSLPVIFGDLLREHAGCWESRYGYSKTVLEVGCHKGDVLRDLAQDHADTLFVGMDITFKRVVETARKAVKHDLPNMKSVLANGQGVGQVFSDSELDGVVVFYPDPWTRKKRQLKNRLVNSEFLGSVARILKPGGFFWFKTDHGGYFQDVVKFAAEAGLEIKAPDDHSVTCRPYTSRFEHEFERRQVPKFEVFFGKQSVPKS